MSEELKIYMQKMQKVVEDYMDGMLDERYFFHPTLREAVRHIPLAKGKRLRPIYLHLLAESLNEGLGDMTLPFGTAMEMTHNFTLVHDDIMDNADKRHGVVAVHRKWDTNTAINAGDALYSRAFELLIQEYEPELAARLVGELSHMVIRIAEGQQSDMEFEKRQAITEEEYIHMVEDKTARMFQYASRAAGIFNGMGMEDIARLGEMGCMFGIGFQIADDILDLTADEKKFKKPVGGDIREGKKTIIIIHAMNNMDTAVKEEFQRILGKADATSTEVETAIEMLRQSGSIDYARSVGKKYISDAQDIMNDIVPDSDNKELLSRLINYMIDREY